jgi:hypothetical protein
MTTQDIKFNSISLHQPERVNIVYSPNPHITIRCHDVSDTHIAAMTALYSPVREVPMQCGLISLQGYGVKATLTMQHDPYGLYESFPNCMITRITVSERSADSKIRDMEIVFAQHTMTGLII